MNSHASIVRTNGNPVFGSWFGPAFAFFAIGLVAGAIFTVLGGIPGVRALGVFALTASAFGMVVVGYTLRTEDPETWLAVVDRAKALSGAAASSWRTMAARNRIARQLKGSSGPAGIE